MSDKESKMLETIRRLTAENLRIADLYDREKSRAVMLEQERGDAEIYRQRCEELRAENERLKLMGTRTSYAALAEENNALRAENKELHADIDNFESAICTECEKLRAERDLLAEELKDNAGEAIRECLAENDELRAQCEKLAAALAEISSCETDDDHTLHMSVTATEALAEYKKAKKLHNKK